MSETPSTSATEMRNAKKDKIAEFLSDSNKLLSTTQAATTSEELIEVVKKKEYQLLYLKVKNNFDDFKNAMKKFEEEKKILQEDDKHVEDAVRANFEACVEHIRTFSDGRSADDYLNEIWNA